MTAWNKKGTISAIESGRGCSGDYILAIGHFFGMELSELANYKLSLSDEMEFRSRIGKYHKKHKSTAYEVLDEYPNLNAVIEFRLARTEFLLATPRSVKEINNSSDIKERISVSQQISSRARRMKYLEIQERKIP